MGKKIVLTGVTLTDATAPTLAMVDPIETDGSIYLFDFAHPMASVPSGVPTNGATATNLLADKGATTVGSAATAAWEMGAGYDGTKGMIERSGKGGLHGVISPTLGDSTTYARIQLGSNIKAYMIANPAHTYYLSVWGEITKAPSAVGGAYTGIRAAIFNNTVASANYLVRLYGSQSTRFSTAAGPLIANHSVSAWTGTVPASASGMSARLAELPTDPTYNSSDTMRRAQGGFVLYRAYLEDLTASGRSYAEVDAIDYALYTTEVLTSGGRYYGDTYTDPVTIP